MPQPRTILTFGDSNTWGRNPADASRFDWNTRWPGVLQRELGTNYRVLEEGLNARTTVWDDPVDPHRNGLAYLHPCLMSHAPLDLVVLMLGTNDLKSRFNVSPLEIGRSVAQLLRAIRYSESGPGAGPPPTLLMCPPPVAKLSDLAPMFVGAEEKSRQLAPHYAEQARLHDAEFLDTGDVIRSSDLDGIHFEASEHEKLGQAVAHRVRAMLASTASP